METALVAINVVDYSYPLMRLDRELKLERTEQSAPLFIYALMRQDGLDDGGNLVADQSTFETPQYREQVNAYFWSLTDRLPECKYWFLLYARLDRDRKPFIDSKAAFLDRPPLPDLASTNHYPLLLPLEKRQPLPFTSYEDAHFMGFRFFAVPEESELHQTFCRVSGDPLKFVRPLDALRRPHQFAFDQSLLEASLCGDHAAQQIGITLSEALTWEVACQVLEETYERPAIRLEMTANTFWRKWDSMSGLYRWPISSWDSPAPHKNPR